VIDRQFMGVAFTPNSKSLVSSSLDGFVRVWDVETGLTLRAMEGHPAGALGLSLSPDARFAVVGTGQNLVKIWELSTGKEVRKFENTGRKGILNAIYAPDGKSVAFGGDDGDVVIGDTATGKYRILGNCPTPIRAMAWSPDGRWIATGSADRLLRLWEPATGKVTGLPLENGFYSVAFSPKGDLLAAGGADWSLRLWDLRGARK
jgi:WD40 repeat protein